MQPLSLDAMNSPSTPHSDLEMSAVKSSVVISKEDAERIAEENVQIMIQNLRAHRDAALQQSVSNNVVPPEDLGA